MAEILTLSLSEPLETLAEGLGRSFAETGFAMVRDHGVDAELYAQTQSALETFMALPEEVKRCYHLPGMAGARGYTPFGIERAKDASIHDLKEFYHVGRDLPPGDWLADLMPPNIWPEEVPELREASLALFDAFEATGLRICEAIALNCGLSPETMANALDGGNSVLRLLHYPPMPPDVPEGAVRAAPHEDINVITLLLGAEEAGLELLTRDGKWLPVTPGEGTMVVNIADMLQRLTAGRLRSTTHRVVNPGGEAARRSRYSTPFFLHFRPDFLIEAQGEGAQEPITAHDYLQQRLREIALA